MGSRWSRSRAQAGFSLTETLAAMVVLAIATGMVTAAMAFATRTYHDQNFVTQSAVLSGSLDNALASAYRPAKVKNGTLIVHYSKFYLTNPTLIEDAGMIYLEAEDGQRVKLLNAGSYGNCAATLNEVKPYLSESTYSIEGSYTISDTTNPSYSHTYEFYYKNNTALEN